MVAVAPFNTLAPWLEAQFGRSVHRIALDAGSTCPNRDGSKGYGGCAYCDVEGSGTGALRRGEEIAAQLQAGLRKLARRGPEWRAIAYFQSYSNTYVSPARLREVLAAVEPELGARVVALSIATRPDTLDEHALDELVRVAQRVPVWVELGLESASDRVLAEINRLHTLRDFEDAAARVRARHLLLVVHAILGLPGDGREGARRTAEAIAASGASGVKVHHLMVLRRTILERWWRDGRVPTLEVDEYVDWLADFVERLAPDQVLHRITGDAPAEQLLAPRWPVDKNVVRERLARELARRGSRQGALRHAR